MQVFDDPNPSGMCKCGCGRKTTVIKHNNTWKRHTIGNHREYVKGHQPVTRYYGPRADYIEVDAKSGCWVWTGARSNGYGVIWDGERTHLAHRYYYEQEHGRLDRGTVLHHVCRNRACVNPSHLDAMSNGEHTHLHLLERWGVSA